LNSTPLILAACCSDLVALAYLLELLCGVLGDVGVAGSQNRPTLSFKSPKAASARRNAGTNEPSSRTLSRVTGGNAGKMMRRN
jgi:hypothetical protein